MSYDLCSFNFSINYGLKTRTILQAGCLPEIDLPAKLKSSEEVTIMACKKGGCKSKGSKGGKGGKGGC